MYSVVIGIMFCVNYIVPLALLGHLAVASVNISLLKINICMCSIDIITGVLHLFTG